MPDPTHADFALAYDTRTGDKQYVPRVWLDQNIYPHLQEAPSERDAHGPSGPSDSTETEPPASWPIDPVQED